MADSPIDPLRIDKWLWAARFFKTRALARAAVEGGKVSINGARAKPSKTIKPGDELVVQRGLEELTVHIVALSAQRGSAVIAQALYQETPDSLARRTALAAERALQRANDTGPDRRPDKRQRRQIIRFTRGS